MQSASGLPRAFCCCMLFTVFTSTSITVRFGALYDLMGPLPASPAAAAGGAGFRNGWAAADGAGGATGGGCGGRATGGGAANEPADGRLGSPGREPCCAAGLADSFSVKCECGSEVPAGGCCGAGAPSFDSIPGLRKIS